MKTISKLIGALSLLAVASCYGHDKKRVADTNTNWLDCETDDDCDDGLTCIASMCSAGELNDSDAEIQERDAAEQPRSPEQVGLTLVAEVLTLSDPEGMADDPAVGRVDGGGVAVAWLSATEGSSGAKALYVAEVAGERIDVTYEVALPEVIGPQTRLIGVSSVGQAILVDSPQGSVLAASRCALTFARWGSEDFNGIAIPCSDGSAYAADIADTGEWLIATTEGDDVLVGVYGANDQWMTPLTSIGQHRGATGIALDGNGEAASLLWGTRDAARGFGIEDVDRPASGKVLERHDGAREVGGQYAIVQLEDRAIAVGVHGADLWSSVVSSSAASSARSVAKARGYGGALPSLAVSEDQQLLAACYATSSRPGGYVEVSVIVIDREGRPASEPVMLVDDVWESGSCDLAWSADALVVAWSHGIPVDPQVGHTQRFVRAQRLIVER